MNDEKLLEFTKAKLNDESDLFLLDEIEMTQQKIEEATQVFNEGLSRLAEEVKKKEAEEITFEIDPEEIRGEKGEQGERGERGEKGEQGDSIIGPPGPIGLPGKDGLDGLDGKDGKDGVSVVNTKIENDDLIVELSDGRKINVGRVKGEKGDKGRALIGGGGKHRIYASGAALNGVEELNIAGNGATVSQTGNRVTITVNDTTGVSESLAIAYAVAL